MTIDHLKVTSVDFWPRWKHTYTPVPPRTTKRRTTNLKTKKHQNWQIINLYGSPTTNELKKKHSPRLVGGAETGNRAERTCGKAVARGPGQARWWLAQQVVTHVSADKLGGTTVERDRWHNPGFQCREIKPQILWLKKPVRAEVVGKPPASQESSLERPTGS